MMWCTKIDCCVFCKVLLEVRLVWLPLAFTAVAMKTPNHYKKNRCLCSRIKAEVANNMRRNEYAEASVPSLPCTKGCSSSPSSSQDEKWRWRVLVPFNPQPHAQQQNQHRHLRIYLAEVRAMSHFAGDVKNPPAENSFWSQSLLRPFPGHGPPPRLGVPCEAAGGPQELAASTRATCGCRSLLLVDLFVNEFCLKVSSCRNLAKGLLRNTSTNSVVTLHTGLLHSVTFSLMDDVPKRGVYVINA